MDHHQAPDQQVFVTMDINKNMVHELVHVLQDIQLSMEGIDTQGDCTAPPSGQPVFVERPFLLHGCVLEQELKHCKQAEQSTRQRLAQWEGTRLHKDMLGTWRGTSDKNRAEITIARDGLTLRDASSSNAYAYRRLAPYAIIVEHKYGKSVLVLLACCAQLLEVNFTRGERWVFQKVRGKTDSHSKKSEGAPPQIPAGGCLGLPGDVCSGHVARTVAEEIRKTRQQSEECNRMLSHWEGSRLHPGMLGRWAAVDHQAELTICGSKLAVDWKDGNGNSDYRYERLAPYAVIAHHRHGKSHFTLLPGCDQLSEVNFSGGGKCWTFQKGQ